MSSPTEYRPTPYPREDSGPYNGQSQGVHFDPPLTSIKEQAEAHAKRHVKNTIQMITRHNEEIDRLEGLLQDYRDAVETLKSTLPVDALEDLKNGLGADTAPV